MSAPPSTRTAAADLTDAPRLGPAGEGSAPRLRLEPTGSSRILLDGGWWPRSTDPVAELPDLVLAIGSLREPVTRLVFPAQRPPPGPALPPYRATAGDVRNGPMRDIKEQPMKIARHRITDALRARGQHVRADWIRRELPDEVDLAQHAGLLATLHLDPADLAEAPTT